MAASSTSGFGELAAKPSIFGSGSATTTSPFGSLLASNQKGASGSNSMRETAATGTSSTFGATFGESSTGGFGAQTSLGFGGGFGSAFGGGFAANPSKTLSNFSSQNPDISALSKPAKAFGAPESDEEDESGDDGDDDGVGSDDEDENATYEDKKKPKLTKGMSEMELC